MRTLIALTTLAFVARKGITALMTLFALHLGAGPFEVSIIFALFGFFPTLLVIYVGRLADRVSNRILSYAGLGGFAISLLIPVVIPGMTALLVCALLVGGTSMIFVVASQNLIGVLSTPQTRTTNYSYYSLGESVAAVGAPILIGYTIDSYGHIPGFAVLAAFLVTGVILLRISHNALVPMGNAVPPVVSRPKVRELLALPALRNALLANSVVMMGMDLYMLYLPVHGHSSGLSASTIGMIMGAFGAAAFVVRTLIPPLSKRWGEHGMLTVALGFAAAGFFAMPMTANPYLLAIASFSVGLGIGCGQPLTTILAFNAAPPGRSAEAISIRLVTSYGAHVVVPPVIGAVGAALGATVAFWGCAVLLCGGMLVTRNMSTNKTDTPGR
jgi:MFS family permease